AEPLVVDKVNNPIAVSAIADPVKIAGPVDVNVSGVKLDLSSTKFVSADTDIKQLVAGPGYNNAMPAKPMVAGPFVITDVSMGNGGGILTVGVDNSCPVVKADMTINMNAPNGFGLQIHGARIPVPTGSVACVSGQGNLDSWFSGFKPY